MKKMTHFQAPKQPLLTSQDIVHALVLIAISLLFGLIPAYAFGQSTLGSMSDVFSGLDPLSPPAVAAIPAPAAASSVPLMTETSEPAGDSAVPNTAIPNVEDFFAPQREEQPAVPASAAAEVSPLTANPYSSAQSSPYQQSAQQSLQQRALSQRELMQREWVQRDVAFSADHPFQQYWGVPNGPQTGITGKPMAVAELLAGTRSPSVRGQLLQAYWELGGLLAIYHFRCENERLAMGTGGVQQDGMAALLREQRRTAELEFIKQQWFLAELLKQYKGRTLREPELPIPADYPIYSRYQTFADQIARTERTQYLGRMIPIQEQLIESKNGTWKAMSAMSQPASQPFFVLSNQRTAAFLDLTMAIVEYNKMIAEYAMDTIPPNVSTEQLVGTVVRKPQGNAIPVQPQASQLATGGVTLTQYEVPMGVTAQPVAQMGYVYQKIAENRAENGALVERFESEPEEQAVPMIPADPLMMDF